MIHWSKEELELLKSDKTNEEIERVTGRSAIAVRTKRYKYTGHYVEEDEWRSDEFMTNVCPSLSQSEKLRRIYVLAAQMKVKLKGENR